MEILGSLKKIRYIYPYRSKIFLRKPNYIYIRLYIMVNPNVVQIPWEIGPILKTRGDPPIQFYGFSSVCSAFFLIRKIRCQTCIFATTRRKRLRSGEVTPLEVAIMRAFYHGSFSEGHQMVSQKCWFFALSGFVDQLPVIVWSSRHPELRKCGTPVSYTHLTLPTKRIV